jgi:thioredoxin-like negative regulator of GroEL
VHGLEREWYQEVDFVYLDIDDNNNDQFKRMFGYQYQPHIFLLDGNGNVVDQWVGFVSENELRAALVNITQQ